MMSLSVALTCTLTLSGAIAPELGDVQWNRDYKAALEQARADNKPVLVLFDEVPGCQTCVRYGQAVLGHPLVVEAAQTLFVPVAVYNNKGGADRAVLKRFKEPTWNNPVVRIIDADERPLAPRIAGDYTVAGLVHGMVQALERSKKPVPNYLRVLASEHLTGNAAPARATFSMYCFWTGEVCLGGIPGVVGTRTGFVAGREVVEVEYDPGRTSYAALVKEAQGRTCFRSVLTRNDKELATARAIVGGAAVAVDRRIRPSTKDDKYQLRHSPWRFVPMTGLQATLANRLLGQRKDPSAVMSPQQRAIYRVVSRAPNGDWTDQVAKPEPLREAFAALARKL